MVIKRTLEYDNLIRFEEDGHMYFSNRNGCQFKSMSHVLNDLKEPFNTNEIAMNVARSKLGWDCKDWKVINKKKEELITQWDEKKIMASEYGSKIHKDLEDYYRIQKIKVEYDHVYKYINNIIGWSSRIINEKILAAEDYQIAGTADLVSIRRKSKVPIIDVFDFKTNMEKGIVFDSIKRDIEGNVKKHYDRYLMHPFEHLEDSNYMIYSLQLSGYAYMIETSYECKIGRLAIFFVSKDENGIFKAKEIPVSYMKREIEELFWFHKYGKKIA